MASVSDRGSLVKLYHIISKENYLYVKGVLPYVKVTFVLLIRKIYILINFLAIKISIVI